MIVHEEFRVELQAPEGKCCEALGCYNNGSHGLLVHNDHEVLVFHKQDLCSAHTLLAVLTVFTKGIEGLLSIGDF